MKEHAKKPMNSKFQPSLTHFRIDMKESLKGENNHILELARNDYYI
jgi:hypothetical protein